VLTDINMPEMDGYQLCKSVTKNPLTQNIPVIMLSGKDGLFDKLRGKLVGSTDHMSKPFSPRDLLRVVRSHLEASSVWSH
jgi:twitching motility two-component system response regulator PilG